LLEKKEKAKQDIVMKSTNTEPYSLSRRDLAERWGCSIETIKRREKAGILRAMRLGGLVRYRLSDIRKIEGESEDI
jgi:predicted site-specific integrase-resolvase